ncbi:hypothetical protein PF008_g7821 [Phytophthora fragariae]|uniref:Uncharacterized protein n=1 Tax=Phytophthora fragariae TaxID=53985 RepID=A0A6G0S1C6_9STRA|nr:hypothetical protein PF008_g7821 [Phytophthora fragariae]
MTAIVLASATTTATLEATSSMRRGGDEISDSDAAEMDEAFGRLCILEAAVN